MDNENCLLDNEAEQFDESSYQSLASEVDTLFSEIPDFTRSWNVATQVIKDFSPVAWPLWRLNSYIFSRSGKINIPPEGMLLGYLKFFQQMCQDPTFELPSVIKSNEMVAKLVPADLIVSTLFVHSVCCRLNHQSLRKIWGGMLDDALIRSRIGYELGRYNSNFGLGRSMIAGFSGRIGLVILIATGTHQQAARTLQELARGGSITSTGLEVYQTDPIHVAAHLMLFGGLGVDAVIGVLAYGSSSFRADNDLQECWRSSLFVLDAARAVTYGKLDSRDWQKFNLLDPELREKFKEEAKQILRRGHGWHWVLTPL